MPVFTIPNIFLHKNLGYYIILPLALLVIGLILSTHLTLDTSLSGGINVIMQTNATFSTATLASQLGSMLNVATPTVFQSPGTVQVTISDNQSISNAQNYLLNFYAYKSNYTTWFFNATTLQNAYHINSSNQSALNQLKIANQQVNISLAGMNSQIALELNSLSNFVGPQTYNNADPENMSTVAQNAYTNSTFIYKQKVLTTLHSLIPFSTYTYQEVTPTLSKFFLGQVIGVIIAAFVLISIAVLVIFRSWAPSLAIIFGAGNDIIIALGAMVILNIPLGLASLGGLLMLIGYAIDTEMITAVRILKRKEGTPEERAYGAMKTGLTMTIAAIASFAVLFAVSLIAYVPTYYQISGVVLFGLIGDIITTWFGNAPLILMYKKRHDRA